MPFLSKNLDFYMGPEAVGAPDDLEAVIIDFMLGAKKSLKIAVQELDHIPIAEAIIRVKREKDVQVEIILEGDYLHNPLEIADPFAPGGRHEINREIQLALFRSGIHVKTDYNPKIFHQKFIIRDGKHILTGSTNFTTTGVKNNLNHIVVIRNRHICALYEKEYAEMMRGKFGQESDSDWGAPKQYKIRDNYVQAVFAPDQGPEMEIMKQMLKARDRVDIAMFTFSTSSGIDDTINMLCKAGLTVRASMEGLQANQSWAATHPIHKAGAEVFLVNKQGDLGKLHHKLLVIDDQLVIAGSFNYTGPANYINDENIILIGDLDETDPATVAEQKRLAGFIRTEMARIIRDHGVRFSG